MKIVRQRRSNMIGNRAEYTNRIAPQPANFRELKKNSTPRYHGDTLRVHVGGRKLQVRRFIFWNNYVLQYNVLLYAFDSIALSCFLPIEIIDIWRYHRGMKGILCIKFDLFKIKSTDFWAAYGHRRLGRAKMPL